MYYNSQINSYGLTIFLNTNLQVTGKEMQDEKNIFFGGDGDGRVEYAALYTSPGS